RIVAQGAVRDAGEVEVPAQKAHFALADGLGGHGRGIHGVEAAQGVVAARDAQVHAVPKLVGVADIDAVEGERFVEVKRIHVGRAAAAFVGIAAAHVAPDFADQARGQAVAQLHVAQLQVGSIFDEVGRSAAFVVGVYQRRGRDAGAGIGRRPGIEQPRAPVFTRSQR
nr:hypothetical protein [Tanacetum cinerariifolium]